MAVAFGVEIAEGESGGERRKSEFRLVTSAPSALWGVPIAEPPRERRERRGIPQRAEGAEAADGIQIP